MPRCSTFSWLTKLSLQSPTLSHGRRVPFAFVSSYSRSYLPSAHRDRPYIRKPFMDSDMRDTIKSLLGHMPTSETQDGNCRGSR
jgi:hypothetical protein